MFRLYGDEHIPTDLVKRLCQMGYDVVTVAEAGRSGGSDPQVLADATADGRAVLTFNRWDFERLHRKSSQHAGIVSCTPDVDSDALAIRIDQAVQASGTLSGKHLRVDLPP